MIAIGMLAALGQAIQTGIHFTIIAALCVLGVVVILVAAGLATRPGWKPRRMRQAEQPPLLVQVDPGELARALSEDDGTGPLSLDLTTPIPRHEAGPEGRHQ